MKQKALKLVFPLLLMLCLQDVGKTNVIQLTFDQKDHEIGVFGAWSPDDQWIVYGCGPNHLNDVIEKVNIKTGEITTLYKIDRQTEYGPGCGTPSYCPTQSKVVFIHGPRKFGPDQKYEFWRRSGVVIVEPNYNELVFIDARDVTVPFTPGASRGGTHCHEFSYDGDLIAFTYNDMIMTQRDHKLDLRTIGVSKKLRRVSVDKDPNGENFDGQWFMVLLVEVVPEPIPGSDEISRAYENCWVGIKGYKTKAGTWQRAIAFKGKTVDANGKIIPEVYIVDIPEGIDQADIDSPLEGTMAKFPSPPKGTEWRRLTHTENRKYPGLSTYPRFWLRSSHKGDKIFFLARDDNGINQIYYVQTVGGDIVQVTTLSTDVMSTPSLSSDDRKICYVSDGSVYITTLAKGETIWATEKDAINSSPIWSHDGKMICFCKPIANYNRVTKQIFIVNIE